MMDACLAVEKEIDKVLAKFDGVNEHVKNVLDEIVVYLQALKDELEQCPSDHKLTEDQVLSIKSILPKLRDEAQKIVIDHRDLHSSVSKVGKAIDRNFTFDIEGCTVDDAFSSPEDAKLLNQVICQHFHRQGRLEIAEDLAVEAGIITNDERKKPYTELNRILNSLKSKDLDPAIEWAAENREYIKQSCLEFKLHRLKFITIVQKGVPYQSEAINYARNHFGRFVDRYEKEIQSLMGVFLYLPRGLNSSPYSSYLQPAWWSEIHEIFTKDACNLMGLSVDSPLSISIDAGCTALPHLLSIKHLMQQRQVSSIWSGKDELPVEIDLGPDHQYHSVFACPILRQQSSESNPPMRLLCGHVISRDALLKLVNNANKLKCPYCPVEQSSSEAREILF